MRIRNLRLRVLLFGEAVFFAGPMDGTIVNVSRLAAVGLVLPEWPAVIRHSSGARRLVHNTAARPSWDAQWAADETWEGNYRYRHCADRFVFWATELRTRTEHMARSA